MPPSSPPPLPTGALNVSLPPDQPQAGESAAGFDAARYRRKYPLLRTITLVMRCVAGAIALAMLAGFLFGLVRIFQAEGQDERWLAAAIGVGSLLIGAYWSIVVLAFAELIQVALDIEQNTRRP